MSWLAYIVAAIGILFLGFAAFVRLAPNDPAAVHGDPLTDGASGANAAYLGPPEAPVYAAGPEALFAALDAAVLALPRSTRVAAGPGDYHASYVVRSALMGYPDYVSVKAVPAEGGASYAIWSRSRFGRSDLGVNAERVEALRGALAAEFGGS
ncbi:MAG: DUF1499 domain-containing protein [Paracoccaceae bacterium]|nr:DUF1499 domain-containing protein [Paracoccaceae bacterium]